MTERLFGEFLTQQGRSRVCLYVDSNTPAHGVSSMATYTVKFLDRNATDWVTVKAGLTKAQAIKLKNRLWHTVVTGTPKVVEE